MKKTRASTETGQTLPDDLVAKIIAMMPFPSVLKARSLSKAWRYRCSPLVARDDTQYDEEENRLATSFQADVRERAKRLGMFFPVCIDKEICVTYDWESENWVRLPSLSFLPKDLLDGAFIPLHEPANIPGLVFVTKIRPNMEECFVVANIFTRSWKLLPPRPGLRTPYPGFRYYKGGRLIEHCPRLVMDSPTGPYKVIAFARNGARVWFANVYDSRTNTWSLTKLLKTLSQPWTFAYLNGVLYTVTDASNSDLQELFTLNVEEGTKEILPLRYSNRPELSRRNLVVWDGQLFMVLYYYCDLQVRILKVDLESRELLEVSRGPLNSFNLHGVRLASIQGSRILFELRGRYTRFGTGPIVAYDLLKDEWIWLKFPALCTTSLIKGNEASELLRLTESDTPVETRQDLTFEPSLDPFWQV